MTAEALRQAAALMRERGKARKVMPGGASRCDRADHPARAHGHYGYGGRYWCTDFGSPLLSEENMGSRRAYAKPVESHDTFLLAVADLLDAEAAKCKQQADFDRAYGLEPDEAILAARANDMRHALAVARAYLEVVR